MTPEIGITSTPVIDRTAGAHGTIYVVAMTKDCFIQLPPAAACARHHHGRGVLSGPTEIDATCGATTFVAGQYEERAALLLMNGTIYTTWASHCDDRPYGGWIIAYQRVHARAHGRAQCRVGCERRGFASQGPSIWMSGGGPAADSAGNVYLLTANGRFDTTLNAGGFPSRGDYGNSFREDLVSRRLTGGRRLLRHVQRSCRVHQRRRSRLRRNHAASRHDRRQRRRCGIWQSERARTAISMSSIETHGQVQFRRETSGRNSTEYLGGGVWATPAYFNSNVTTAPETAP